MPPSSVKTIRDVIFWQYAKIIAESAGIGKKDYGFIQAKYQQLKKNEIEWSSSVREWLREHEKENECIYCGKKDNLTTEHILPRDRNGPETVDNVIRVCKSCNSKKGDKRLYEYYTEKNRDKVPRIAEGKYLKLLYKLHEEQGTLDDHYDCTICDLKSKCKEEGHENKLTVYCIEGCFKKL